MRLLVTIPGNPWAGAINKRDGATSRGGKARIFKRAGYHEAQDHAAACIREAVRAQGVAFLRGPVIVTITWYLDRRSWQYDLPSWCPAADVDGPGKCYLDALRLTLKRGRVTVPGGGALSDDVQACDFYQRKRVGVPRATVLVARLTERAGAC